MAPVRAKIVVPLQVVPNLIAALQEHMRVYNESTGGSWDKVRCTERRGLTRPEREAPNANPEPTPRTEPPAPRTELRTESRPFSRETRLLPLTRNRHLAPPTNTLRLPVYTPVWHGQRSRSRQRWRQARPGARVAALFDAHHQRLFRLARRLARAPEDRRATWFRKPSFAPPVRRSGAARRLARRGLAGPRPDQHLPRSWRQVAVRRVPQPSTRAARLRRSRAGADRALDGVAGARRLPPRRRAILILYELEGTPIPAIARLLGVTAGDGALAPLRGRREMARALGAGNS